ncbi:hypothetical protein [Bacillus sp. AK128]
MKLGKKVMKAGTIAILATGVLFGGTMGFQQGEAFAKTSVVKKSTSVKATGTYAGLADQQSFEVKLGKDTKVIRLPEKNKHLVKGLKKGDSITITYWVNVKGQNILGNTLTKGSIKNTSTKATGQYIGMADQQSFEVKIGKDHKVIRVTTENANKIKGLKSGQTITFSYWVNVKGQNILGKTLKKGK